MGWVYTINNVNIFICVICCNLNGKTYITDKNRISTENRVEGKF